MKTKLLKLTLGSLLMASPAIADSIVLKRSVRMRHADSRITLADVAVLEGTQANQYSGVVLDRFEDRSRSMRISVQQVSDALDRAGVNWARIELSGGTAVVRPYSDRGQTPQDPEACAPLELDGAGLEADVHDELLEGPVATTDQPILSIDPHDIVNEDTARGLIAPRLAELWRNNDTPVRIHLQTNRTGLLDEKGLRPRVSLLGRIKNGSARFKVVMQDQGVMEVEACLEVERLSHRARTDLARGNRVSHADFESQTEWVRLTESGDTRAGLDIILGGALARNVKAGMPFASRDFVPTIQRNDPIRVRSSSTGFNLTLDCVSLEDGHVGDTIQVKPDVPGTRNRNERVIRVVILDSNTAETLN